MFFRLYSTIMQIKQQLSKNLKRPTVDIISDNARSDYEQLIIIIIIIIND